MTLRRNISQYGSERRSGRQLATSTHANFSPGFFFFLPARVLRNPEFTLRVMGRVVYRCPLLHALVPVRRRENPEVRSYCQRRAQSFRSLEGPVTAETPRQTSSPSSCSASLNPSLKMPNWGDVGVSFAEGLTEKCSAHVTIEMVALGIYTPSLERGFAGSRLVP